MDLNSVAVFFQVLNTLLLGSLIFIVYKYLKKKK